MRTRLKLYLLGSLATVVAASVLYLLTLGHYFLPFHGSAHFGNEKLELWSFSSYPLVMPSTSPTISGSLDRLIWSIKNPGQARLLAIAKRLETEAPNEDHRLKELLEKIGYPFPAGCGASSPEIVPGWRITHYPSMLRRIQKDFHLMVTWREPLGSDKKPSPNPQGGANGRQPIHSETNGASAAASSGRSP